MESLAKTKARLDQLYETFGPAHATEDPIWLPRRYARAEDREIVAFVVAALAYGRLAQIRRSAEVVLGYLGERPARAVRRLDPERAARDLRGFRHRLNSGRDVALMLHILGRLLSEHGSLHAAFMSGYDPSRENIGPALSAFCRLALSVESPRLDPPRRGPSRAGVRWFFSSPEDGSACKRQNMFLRWMVRRGGVDLGLWSGILPSKLVMPLDTHVARISRRLGFSRRRSADWRMALEVTEALRRFDPDDPVRYDYALYNWDLSSAGTSHPPARRAPPTRIAMRLGAHMSISGGVHRALDRGAEIACDAIQLFTGSNQQWRARPIGQKEAVLFRRRQIEHGIFPAVAHASYLINMASPDGRLRRRSAGALLREIDRCDRLGLPYLIVHPGAHMGAGEEAAFDAVAGVIDGALRRRPASKTMILLENTAGMGTSVGHRFEHLASILERLQERRRVAVCIDTCHLFAAGYDISTASGYRSVMERLDRVLGLDQVRTLHLNDSKRGLGSRVDRHEHIGAGCLGVTAFWCFLNDERFDGVPMLLETPKGPEMAEDRRNLALLRAQIGSPRPVSGAAARVAVRSPRPRAGRRGAGARAGRSGRRRSSSARRPAASKRRR